MKDYIDRPSFIERSIHAVGDHFELRAADTEISESPSSRAFVPSSRLLTKQELEEATLMSQTATL